MIFNPEYEGESFMNLGDKCELKKDAMGNCLSTTKKTNGAVAVFLPGVAEQLAYMLDSDFYMVFTSVHEVMIHNDKFAVCCAGYDQGGYTERGLSDVDNLPVQ